MTIQEFYTAVDGDYNAAKKVMMMDQMILRCLPMLAQDSACAKLRDAWEKRDRVGVFEALHAMKGVCANLGLTSLSGKAAKALEPLRPGSTLTISDEELSEQISEIQEQFDMTIARIRELG